MHDGSQYNEAVAVFVSLIPALALLLAQDASLIDAPTHYQLGLALGKAGDFAGAERQFRVVLKLRPHDAAAHFNLGLALIGNPSEKLDWSGALAEFRRALHEKPDYPEARRMVAECLLNTGEPGAAAGELRTLLKARPSYTQARFRLACALEGASPDEAIGELRRVVKEKPGCAEAHSMLGKLLHQMRRKPDAALELEKALRLNPDLAAAHLTLAALYQQDGDARAAIEQAQ